MQKDWYKSWFNTPYYHKLYFQRDEKEAEDFIARLIAKLQPTPKARMLDVACGKGRHAVQLASMGFEVTGIDLSEKSIEAAIAHETENLSFFQHDMRLPFRMHYYDYAFNFFTSFGYFNTQREHDNSIRTISQSLKKGGLFVMDYLNVKDAENNLVPQSELEIEGTRYEIKRWHDSHHFFKNITVYDQALKEPLVFTEKVAKFSLGDFTEMFAYQGMQLQEVYGDYQFNAYQLTRSPRLLMFAKKI